MCDAYGMYVCDEANIETHGLVLIGKENMLANDASWEAQNSQKVYLQ